MQAACLAASGKRVGEALQVSVGLGDSVPAMKQEFGLERGQLARCSSPRGT